MSSSSSSFKRNRTSKKDIQLSKVSSNEPNDTSPSSSPSSPSSSSYNTLNEPHVSLFDLYIILKSYFWPEKGSDSAILNRIRSTLTWVMVILSKTCSLLSPLYLAYATNNLVNERFQLAILNIFIYCLLKFLTMLFKEFQGMIYLKVKQQANIQLAYQAFSHIHELSLNWHLNKKIGNIMRVMDRGTSAADTLVTYACLYLFPAFLECIAVCIFFIIKFNEWVLSIIIISGIIVYSFATIFITKWRKRFREASNQHDNDYHDKVTDSIINYETVKYFNGEDFEVNRFKKLISQYQSVNVVTILSVSLLNIVQQLIINLTLFGAMFISARRVIHGTLTIGDFIAVNTYTMTVFLPLSNLGMIYNMIVQGLIDIRQFIGLLLTVPDVLDDEDAQDIPLSLPSSGSELNKENLICQSCMKPIQTGWVCCPYCRADTFTSNVLSTIPRSIPQNGVSIEFKNVIFHYPSQPSSSGLKGISFYVKPGTTTAIVGHSGSGKTTVSRLLYRFYDPLSGEVKIGGYNIRNYTQKSIRKFIGIVPQDTVLFNDTLLHNIHYGNMSASISEVEVVAESAKIKSFIESLPEGWNTVVGERGLKLSGGEKQRVAIARCLLKNPPIVILDEATSALDTITELSVQESLNTLGTNRTVLIIAHRLSTIMNADQILVMDNGEIIEKGTHEELLQLKDGKYAALWMKQYKQQIQDQNQNQNNDENNENENNEIQQEQEQDEK